MTSGGSFWDVERLSVYRLDLRAQEITMGRDEPRVSIETATPEILHQMHEERPASLGQAKLDILLGRLDETNTALWALRNSEGELVGYAHSAIGTTCNERINWALSITDNEIYLFDTHVFAPFRGCGYHTDALTHLCRGVQGRGYLAAYAMISDTNTPSIRSFVSVGFSRQHGLMHFRRFHRTFRTK